VSLWPEISERDVVVYGVGLRDGLRLLVKQYIPGSSPGEASMAADRVLSPLPLDVQIAVMLAWMKGRFW